MIELTLEQEILLHLLSRSLGAEDALPADKAAEADWLQVAKESTDQMVLLQAFDTASAYKEHIPPGIYSRWRTLSAGVLAKNQQVCEVQKQLCALLTARGYDYIVIKGTASAAFYTKPEMRTLGDVDCLIEREKLSEVRALLEKNGYTDPGDRSSYDVSYEKDGAHIEMHYDLPGIPVGKAGEKLREYFSGVIGRGKESSLDGEAVRYPSDAEHGVIILLHMVHHLLAGGLGLRHLVDWAGFVKHTAQSEMWNGELLPLFREVGLLEYASVMTQVCVRYLGVPCPRWAEPVSDELCALMIKDFFDGGNFGRKDAVRGRSGAVLAQRNITGKERGRIGYLFYTLHSTTVALYPIVRKVPVLYPFVIVWRVIRNIYYQLTGKRPKLGDMFDSAGERKKIYDRLKIFETEE